MNTYGQLSNAALLHKYGFTERDNPHDEVGVSIVQETCIHTDVHPCRQWFPVRPYIWSISSITPTLSAGTAL